MKSISWVWRAGRSWRCAILGAAVVSVVAGLAVVVEARPRALFGDVPDQVAATGSEHRNTDKRTRRVKVEFAVLAADELPEGAPSVALNLFPDVDLTAVKSRFERREGRGYTWFGTVQGDPLSSVVLTTSGGLMYGVVFANDRHFEIRGASAATQVVVEIDQSAFPPEGCDQIPAGNQTQIEPPAGSAQDALADTGAVADVLVVYTTAARVAEGGTAAIELLAQNAVDATNQSYANSGVAPRLNLVHAAEVAYTELADDNAGWNQDLQRLAANGEIGGHMDDVHALRDTYRADVVVLLVNKAFYCGLADAVLADASTAFSMVSRICTASNFSFGHEIGHLQGARHDLYVDPTLGSPYDYNHGDVDLAIRKRTMMAYNDQCAATSPYTFCVRVPYWSNPGVNYPSTSAPTGTASRENNALVLNNTAFTVANFRITRTLTVASTNPASGVPIAVDLADVRGLASGTTTFTRLYAPNAIVTLTAPSPNGDGNDFAAWTGCDATFGGLGEICSVTMGTDKSVVATYVASRILTVASTYPASGVAIAVDLADIDGHASGTTTFTRRYDPGAIVTLTAASPNGDGNDFAAWTGCDGTSGGLGEICSVTMSADKAVVAAYTKLTPTSFTLWSDSSTGRAAVLETDAATNALQNFFWLYSPQGVGAPWKATSYARVDAATAYVLWTRSDTGRTSFWRIDPSVAAGYPPVVPVDSAAALYSAAGIGAPWQATSFEYVGPAEGYILWSRSDLGKAALWRIDPGALATPGVQPPIQVDSSALLDPTGGVGSPWQATSFEYVGPAEAYVLWTRSDVGKAVLSRIDPGALATPGVQPPIESVSSALLHSTAGIGAPWQATGFEYVSPAEGYVLWAHSPIGKAAFWRIDPGALATPGVQPPIPIDSSWVVFSPAGLGSAFEVDSYVR